MHQSPLRIFCEFIQFGQLVEPQGQPEEFAAVGQRTFQLFGIDHGLDLLRLYLLGELWRLPHASYVELGRVLNAGAELITAL